MADILVSGSHCRRRRQCAGCRFGRPDNRGDHRPFNGLFTLSVGKSADFRLVDGDSNFQTPGVVSKRGMMMSGRVIFGILIIKHICCFTISFTRKSTRQEARPRCRSNKALDLQLYNIVSWCKACLRMKQAFQILLLHFHRMDLNSVEGMQPVKPRYK